MIGLDKPRKKIYDIFLSRAYTPAKLEQKLLFAAVKILGRQLLWQWLGQTKMTNEQYTRVSGEAGMKDRYASEGQGKETFPPAGNELLLVCTRPKAGVIGEYQDNLHNSDNKTIQRMTK